MSAEHQHYEVTQVGDVRVVHVKGKRFDDSAYPAISKHIFRMVDREEVKKIVLDFEAIEFLFSESLGMLVALNKRLTQSGCQLRLCRMKRQHLDLLDVSNLRELFEIYDDQQTALESF